MSIPYTFATASGNVPASELDANFSYLWPNWSGTSLATSAAVSVGTTLAVTGASTFTGNVAIGTTPGGYGLTLLQAGSNQAYFGSTGVNNSAVTVDNMAGSNYSLIYLSDAGVNKWYLAKTNTNALTLFDVVGNKSFLGATTGGSLTLGPAQTTNMLQSGAVVVNGSSQISTAALSVPGSASAYCVAISANASSGIGTLFQNSSGTATYTAANFTTNGGGTVVGSIVVSSSATAYNTSSDKRLKENVQPVINSAALIDAMQPVTYDWAYIEGKPRGTGFLAQDLYEVFPEAVSVGDTLPVSDDGSVNFQWSVDYSKLVPILVAEVQSLRKRVASLEAKTGA